MQNAHSKCMYTFYKHPFDSGTNICGSQMWSLMEIFEEIGKVDSYKIIVDSLITIVSKVTVWKKLNFSFDADSTVAAWGKVTFPCGILRERCSIILCSSKMPSFSRVYTRYQLMYKNPSRGQLKLNKQYKQILWL